MNKKDLVRIGISNKEFSSLVYRYFTIDSNCLSCIRESYLWFSNPFKFNDPFDCNILLESNGNLRDYEKYLRRIPNFSFLDESTLREKAKELMTDSQLNNRINNKKEKIIGSLGLCCFSLTKGDIPMWSYYANNHKGVVVGYDLLEIISEAMTPFRVKYDTEFPIFNWIKDGNLKEIAILMLGTKAKAWCHEKEFRIVSSKQGRNDIPRTAIKEIVFGCNVEINDQKEILRIIQDNYKVNKIEVLKAVKHSAGYKLLYERVLKSAM